ncbi:hypothetical protein PAMA_002869 [Pampus argenteus]
MFGPEFLLSWRSPEGPGDERSSVLVSVQRFQAHMLNTFFKRPPEAIKGADNSFNEVPYSGNWDLTPEFKAPDLKPVDGAQMKQPSKQEELARCRTPLALLLLIYGTGSASTCCPPLSREDTVERLLKAHYSLSEAHYC